MASITYCKASSRASPLSPQHWLRACGNSQVATLHHRHSRWATRLQTSQRGSAPTRAEPVGSQGQGFKRTPQKRTSQLNHGSDSETSTSGRSFEEVVTGHKALPKVSRSDVFRACSLNTLLMILAAFVLSNAVEAVGDRVAGPDRAYLHGLLAGHPEAWHLAVVLVVVGMVTSGRMALLNAWPDFAEATNRSNQQVLTAVEPLDVLWVSFLPGISEEYLFRGALIPAVAADWRGILVSGVVFGALHQQGGRNWAFAVWATAVGVLYGASYVYTGNIVVPMGAHALANLLSATLWLRRQTD